MAKYLKINGEFWELHPSTKVDTRNPINLSNFPLIDGNFVNDYGLEQRYAFHSYYNTFFFPESKAHLLKEFAGGFNIEMQPGYFVPIFFRHKYIEKGGDGEEYLWATLDYPPSQTGGKGPAIGGIVNTAYIGSTLSAFIYRTGNGVPVLNIYADNILQVSLDLSKLVFAETGEYVSVTSSDYDTYFKVYDEEDLPKPAEAFSWEQPEGVEIEVSVGQTIENKFVLYPAGYDAIDPFTDVSFKVEFGVIGDAYKDPSEVEYSIFPLGEGGSPNGNFSISEYCPYSVLRVRAYPNGYVDEDGNEMYAEKRFLIENAYDINYGPGGTSGEGGGGGDFGSGGSTGGSTNATVPNGSAEDNYANAGLFTIYAGTVSTLQAVGEKIYAETFLEKIGLELTTLLWNSPIDAVISVQSFPFSIPSGGEKEVKLGAVSLGVSAPVVGNSSFTIEWGSVSLNEFWGNFLDYAPHTKIELCLPWGAGFVPIDPHDCLPGSVSIRTNVEVAKGTCQHIVSGNHGVIGVYGGKCSSEIPLSSLDSGAKFLTTTAAVVATSIGAATGAAGLMAGTNAAGAGTAGALRAGADTQMAISAGRAAERVASAPYQAISRRATQVAVPSAVAALRSPPNITRSGSFYSSGAGLGPQKPFLVISRPEQNVAAGYASHFGYPSNINVGLGQVSGYTEVASIHLTGIPATQPELEEIEELLKKGVIL